MSRDISLTTSAPTLLRRVDLKMDLLRPERHLDVKYISTNSALKTTT